jgi:hypothetical protein
MNTVPRIVVGVDGFESSTAALRWAIHQARLTGTVVEAVTVWHIPPNSGMIPGVDMPDYEDDARMVLTEAIAQTCTSDTDVEVRPKAGTTAALMRISLRFHAGHSARYPTVPCHARAAVGMTVMGCRDLGPGRAAR